MLEKLKHDLAYIKNSWFIEAAVAGLQLPVTVLDSWPSFRFIRIEIKTIGYIVNSVKAFQWNIGENEKLYLYPYCLNFIKKLLKRRYRFLEEIFIYFILCKTAVQENFIDILGQHLWRFRIFFVGGWRVKTVLERTKLLIFSILPKQLIYRRLVIGCSYFLFSVNTATKTKL